MASSGKTQFYQLPLFLSDDKPSWLEDFNDAMTEIDIAIHDAATAAKDTESGAGAALEAATAAQTAATAAQVAAESALADASAAKVQAESAATAAQSAATNASAALTKATSAQTTAETANDTAQTAQLAAGQAQQAATQAEQTAQAAQTASSTNTTAIQNLSTAISNQQTQLSEIQATANSALTTANTATTTANNALNLATDCKKLIQAMMYSFDLDGYSQNNRPFFISTNSYFKLGNSNPMRLVINFEILVSPMTTTNQINFSFNDIAGFLQDSAVPGSFIASGKDWSTNGVTNYSWDGSTTKTNNKVKLTATKADNFQPGHFYAFSHSFTLSLPYPV